jgi:hypothetical protein
MQFPPKSCHDHSKQQNIIVDPFSQAAIPLLHLKFYLQNSWWLNKALPTKNIFSASSFYSVSTFYTYYESTRTKRLCK